MLFAKRVPGSSRPLRAAKQLRGTPRSALRLELLEDRTTPSAGLIEPPPVALPAGEAMAALIAAQPRSLRQMRLFYGMLRDASSSNVQPTTTPGIRGNDITPPAVAGIDFSSSGWQTAFLDALGKPTGFPAQTGANQLVNLPWINVDTIRVTFTEDVNVGATSLRLNGVNVANHAVQDFSYDPLTFTATWRLTNPLSATDKLVLRLDGTGIEQFGPEPISDLSGNRLQGSWVDGVSTFPSGDGTAGVDFNYRFNILPGDVDRDGGPVTPADLERVLIAMFSKPGDADYTVFKDLDGSGEIRNLDLNGVRDHMNQDLPPGDPLAQPLVPVIGNAGISPSGGQTTSSTSQSSAGTTASTSNSGSATTRPTKQQLTTRLNEVVRAGRRLRAPQLAASAGFATLVDALFSSSTH